MTSKMSKLARGFVATLFPGSLIFLPSPLSLWEGGKMRDPGKEVGFVGMGELNKMFYVRWLSFMNIS